MSYEFIRTETRGDMPLVTMNRPEGHNATHSDMQRGMADCGDASAAVTLRLG